MSNLDARELKRALPLPQLMQRLGLGKHAVKSCHSPFREDKHPSFSVFQGADGEWVWHDFGDGTSGDAIDFLARLNGWDSKARFQDILKLYGEHVGRDLTNGGPMHIEEIKSPGRGESGAGQANNESEKTLPQQTHHDKGAFDWGRCVAALTESKLDELADWRGYSAAFCSWLHAQRLIGIHEGKFAVAVHDSAGEVSGFQYVNPTDRNKLWCLAGTTIHPLIIGNQTTARTVWLFESIWDTFAVMDRMGWNQLAPADVAVFCTRGASNGKRVSGRFREKTTVNAFAQNNPRSEGWLATVVNYAGCPVLRVQTPPQHNDPNDWTRAGASKADLLEAIESAHPIERGTRVDLGGAVSPAPTVTGTAAAARTAPPCRKPEIRLPGDNRTLSEFAGDLAAILSDKEIFNWNGRVATLNADRTGMVTVEAEFLRTWVEQHLSCVKVRQIGIGEEKQIFQPKRTMTKADALGVLAAPQFLSRLRPLEAFHPVPMPVQRSNGSIELLAPGYDAQSRIYTINSAVQVRPLTVPESKRVIDELMAEFAFVDPKRSKSVAVAAMLTMFARAIIPRNALRPCFIYLANGEGAGKSLLVKCATVPVMGVAPAGTAAHSEDEMKKVLLATTMEKKHSIFFDNYKGHLASESLEAFLTNQTHSDRVLGESRTFTGENNATVFVTGNGCTVSPDMRRRSLFCEVFIEAERPEDRHIVRPLEVGPLIERREEILSALWGLIRGWHAAGSPGPSRSHTGFPEWASLIAGIVEWAGFGCPLATAEIQGAADVDGQDMRALVSAMTAAAQTMSFDELAALARQQGLFERLWSSSEQLDQSSKAKLGKLLKTYDKRIIGGHRFNVLGKGHSRKFSAEPMQQSTVTR